MSKVISNQGLLVSNIKNDFLNGFKYEIDCIKNSFINLKNKLDSLNRTIVYFDQENYSNPGPHDEVFYTLIDSIQRYLGITYCKTSIEELITNVCNKLQIPLPDSQLSDINKLHNLLTAIEHRTKGLKEIKEIKDSSSDDH
jgi:hypothetical protein